MAFRIYAYQTKCLKCESIFNQVLVIKETDGSFGALSDHKITRHHNTSSPQDLSQDEAAARLKQCEQTAVTSALSAACHGRPQCVVTADPAALHAPACAEQHVALKIAYACMDKVRGRHVSDI